MPRVVAPLSLNKIVNAYQKEKPYRLFDGGGLYIEVTPAGSKLWRMKYLIDGKERRLSFGRFPEVSIREARNKRFTAKALLAAGVDPGQARKFEREKKKMSETSILINGQINGPFLGKKSGKPMRLNKYMRDAVRMKFGGRCAYCGCQLHDRFHVDHMLPVGRKFDWETGFGFKETGEMTHPERDTIDSLMPSCPPCNIDKHAMPLEAWRAKLQRSTEVLMRNNPTYRHALRFAQVCETRRPVVFYFEQVRI